MEYSDPYQGIRMIIIWPALVGAVAFYTVRLIASLVERRLNRWQASMAAICGFMAGVFTTYLSRNWTGSNEYWLAFTVGLAFAALVLVANAVVAVINAEANGHDC